MPADIDTMPGIDLPSLYPSPGWQFWRYCATVFVRIPTICALLAIAIQRLVCGFVPHSDAEATSLSAAVGATPETVFIVVVLATHAVLYTVVNGFFYGIERYDYLKRFKVPRPAKIVAPDELRRKTVRKAVVDALLFQPVAAYAFTHYLAMTPSDVCEPFSFVRGFACVAFGVFINETGFYVVHRLCHEIPFLYRNIHKQHHSYIASVSVAAEYAHPVETVLANTLPSVGVAVLVPVPTVVFAVWVSARLYETLESHSGYCFQDTPLARVLGLLNPTHMAFHDFHHVVNRGNYGTSILWDYVLGTDALYRNKINAAIESNTPKHTNT